MANNKLVGLLIESWKDMDRVLDGLNETEATLPIHGSSSFAWTLAHVTNQVDAGINVQFQKKDRHKLIGQKRFRFGGTGEANEWGTIKSGVEEVRTTARNYLEELDDQGIDLTIPYDGSIKWLRSKGLNLRYTLYRACAHHYFHIGEIATKRNGMGHDVGDYPGLLEESI
tara:strand:- start:330 stop:839 length:510 start_codon:yes stop_codon:yes gene_type:complete